MLWRLPSSTPERGLIRLPFGHYDHPVKWYRRVLAFMAICALAGYILLAISYSTVEQKNDWINILEHEKEQLITELATQELLYEGALQTVQEMQAIIDEQTSTIEALREGAARLSQQLP